MRVYGKNPVTERLRTNPHSIVKLYIEDGCKEAAYYRRKAAKWGLTVYKVNKSKMTKIARNVNHQGVMADIGEFYYENYSELLDQAIAKKRTLVFLDNVTDPQNLGAILRSLGCFGYFSLVIPSHKSVKVTETAIRIASGGDNHVPVSEVSNLNKAIRQAKDEGFTIAGAVLDEAQDLDTVEFNFPLGLVVGSEDKGIRPVVQKELDQTVRIPMYIERLSLNVAHATSIMCYEICRQRRLRG